MSKEDVARANLIKAMEANRARWQFDVWRCTNCGTEKPATRHQQRQTYCSKACMAEGYQTRMRGESNPNFGAQRYTCSTCATVFPAYGDRERKYCSQACYRSPDAPGRPRQHKQMPLRLGPLRKLVKAKPPRLSGIVKRTCIECKVEFEGMRSVPRKFCSYGCFTANGGPFRAGLAATMARVKYGPKKDANHNELMDELRKHCEVQDLSTLGYGVPDGLAWIEEAWRLFDIKNPKTGYGRRGLNPVQKKWLAQSKGGGPVYLLYTTDDARNFGMGKFGEVKCERVNDITFDDALDALRGELEA